MKVHQENQVCKLTRGHVFIRSLTTLAFKVSELCATQVNASFLYQSGAITMSVCNACVPKYPGAQVHKLRNNHV